MKNNTSTNNNNIHIQNFPFKFWFLLGMSSRKRGVQNGTSNILLPGSWMNLSHRRAVGRLSRQMFVCIIFSYVCFAFMPRLSCLCLWLFVLAHKLVHKMKKIYIHICGCQSRQCLNVRRIVLHVENFKISNFNCYCSLWIHHCAVSYCQIMQLRNMHVYIIL